MILPAKEDALHKAMLYRLLSAIIDNRILSRSLYFKGGTCAAMLGYLDRFSIDLDFDLDQHADKKTVIHHIESVSVTAGFSIKEKSKSEAFFLLKYHNPDSKRNTLKVSCVDTPYKANVYEPKLLSEIGRYAQCQTIETMFAHKLIAPTDRYKKYKTIAGRDIYDIHYFFLRGFSYTNAVITERTSLSLSDYLQKLISFIDKNVTKKQLSQDLNYLLTPEKFHAVINTLKMETMIALRDEIERIT
jgi:predicted nucleotidyltransferase component of viral defense system